MATAIIVSGIMRNMANASSSWPWKDNYFLHIENTVYRPQSYQIVGSALDILSDELRKCKVRFKTVTIDIDNIHKHINQIVSPNSNLHSHPILNMLWKWKYSLLYLKMFNKFNVYDKVFLLRPDLYLDFKEDISNFENMILEDNTLYTTGGIVKIPGDPRNFLTMSDVCLAMNFQTLEKISTMYDFYLDFLPYINQTRHDIHSMMAKFVRENDIKVNPILEKILQWAVLRDNSIDMFENQTLKPEYKFWDLMMRQKEWWDNDLKTKGII